MVTVYGANGVVNNYIPPQNNYNNYGASNYNYGTNNNYYAPQQQTNNYYSTNNYTQPQQQQPVVNNYYPVQQSQPQTIVNNYYQQAQQVQQQPVFQQPAQIPVATNVYPQVQAFPMAATAPAYNPYAVAQPIVQQQPVQQQQNSGTSNKMLNMFKMMIQLIAGDGTNPVTGEDLTVDDIQEYLKTGSWGDPHFTANGKQSFDFMGKDGGTYNMIDNKDISLTAKFSDFEKADGKETLVTDQNLEFKDSDINIVSHAGGTFEIYQDGEKIADQNSYKNDDIQKILEEQDINLNYEDDTLTAKHNNREIAQKLVDDRGDGCIDNIKDTIAKSDTGLLTQTAGALDDDFDGKTNMDSDVNKDGTIDENDFLTYNAANQAMVHTEVLEKAEILTDEEKAAIEKDIASGEKQGSVAKGFNANHGYSAAQWNEYIGAKQFAVSDNYLN